MIELRLVELLFILRELSLSEEQVLLLEDELQGVRVKISDDFADALRDLCSDDLDASGFDESYSPNERGLKMEALVDKLFVG